MSCVPCDMNVIIVIISLWGLKRLPSFFKGHSFLVKSFLDLPSL